MKVEQYKHIIEIAKTGSINQAANNLFISQSALSISIKNIEDELGLKIFTRTMRGVELTPFGCNFLSYIEPVFDQLNQIETFFICKGSEPKITLSIANDSFYVVSEICTHLFKKYQDQGFRLVIYDAYSNKAKDLVKNGIAEIGVIRLWSCYKKYELKQIKTMGLDFFPVFHADLAISIGPGNPLFDNEQITTVSPEMLEKFPMIKFDYFDRGPYSELIRELGLGKNSNTLITNSRSIVQDMLDNTDSYILDSMWCRTNLKTPSFRKRRLIPLTLKRKIYSEMGWIVKADTPISKMGREFVNILSQEMHEP